MADVVVQGKVIATPSDQPEAGPYYGPGAAYQAPQAHVQHGQPGRGQNVCNPAYDPIHKGNPRRLFLAMAVQT